MIIISKKAAESELEQMQVEICWLHLAVFALSGQVRDLKVLN